MAARPARPVLILFIAALAAALAATACSRVRLAYNTADFFIASYADDYLGLDDAQKARWTPTLDAALEQHRTEELPYLAAFFDSALADARGGFTRDGVSCLLDQFETLYKRHFRLAAEAAAPLLARLDAAQIDALERTFREESKEDAAEPGAKAAERRARKRAKRYEGNMNWWIGEIDSRQRGIVRDVARRLPDTAPAWYDYRDRKRAELIELLRSGASEPRIARFMVGWIVEFRDMPPSLRQARGALRQGWTDLVLRLDPTFSAEQRARLVERLTMLRDDFLSLQRSPRKAATGC
jgi:uncharacterized lipoprotein YmbA